jgi:hypothetical protein
MFESLTNFLAWLSTYDQEGRRYYQLAKHISDKVVAETVKGADWNRLDKYLEPFLPAKKRALIRQAIETQSTKPVNREVIREQENQIKASFKGFAVKW